MTDRQTVTLTDIEIRQLLRLGDIARERSLSDHGQDSLARLTSRIAARVQVHS